MIAIAKKRGDEKIPHPWVVVGVDKVDVVWEPAHAKGHGHKRKHFHHLYYK